MLSGFVYNNAGRTAPQWTFSLPLRIQERQERKQNTVATSSASLNDETEDYYINIFYIWTIPLFLILVTFVSIFLLFLYAVPYSIIQNLLIVLFWVLLLICELYSLFTLLIYTVMNKNVFKIRVCSFFVCHSLHAGHWPWRHMKKFSTYILKPPQHRSIDILQMYTQKADFRHGIYVWNV